METKVTSPATKGLIISLILIVIGLGFHFAGLDKSKGLTAIPLLIFGAAIIWADINYATQMDGNVTYGIVFAHGFKVTAAVTAIMAVYTFIAFKFIMPELIDASLDEARKKMTDKNMSADQIEQSISMTKNFFIPFAIGGLILIDLILGCIFSLIGAAVAKKNPNYNPLAEN
jgi:hypothetical protein